MSKESKSHRLRHFIWGEKTADSDVNNRQDKVCSIAKLDTDVAKTNATVNFFEHVSKYWKDKHASLKVR